MIKTGFAIFAISTGILLFYLYRYANRRQALLVLSVTYSLAITIYLIGSIAYYKRISSFHLFDPYYQVSPPQFKTPYIKQKHVYRIIALGGSTTRNPSKPENKNYPYLLQQLLQEKYPDVKIEILNGGMNWYSSKHSLMYYTEYAHLFNPDLVIVMDGINDVYRSFSPQGFAIGDFQPGYQHFYGAIINYAKRLTYEQSFFARPFDDLSGYVQVNYPVSDFVALPSFKQFEASLARYIQADGAECLLIMQPSLYQDNIPDSLVGRLWFGKGLCNRIDGNRKIYPDEPSMKTAMDSFTTAVKNIAAQQHCLLLNADSTMPKTLDYFYDDVHYTDKGTQTLARMVYNKIVEAKIIKPAI